MLPLRLLLWGSETLIRQATRWSYIPSSRATPSRIRASSASDLSRLSKLSSRGTSIRRRPLSLGFVLGFHPPRQENAPEPRAVPAARPRRRPWRERALRARGGWRHEDSPPGDLARRSATRQGGGEGKHMSNKG